MPGLAIGTPAEFGQPDALKAGLAEFISMLIFVFAGEGSGMAFSKPPTLLSLCLFKILVMLYVQLTL